MERCIVNPWTWQDARGFVQAHEVTGATQTLYCAGVTSVDADGEVLHLRHGSPATAGAGQP